MNRTSDEVPVATAAPLLRVALIGILLVAALAGVLVAASPLIAWIALAVAVVAGPVIVLFDGRARSRTEVAPRRASREPARVPQELGFNRPRRAA